MPTIDFKYPLGARVNTALGDTGIIDSLGFGGYKNRYWVLLKEGKGAWFDEDQIAPVDQCSQ